MNNTQYSYDLTKRTGKFKQSDSIENTHFSIVDSDIKVIHSLKKKNTNSDYVIIILTNFLTLGLINLLFFINKSLFVKFYYSLCNANDDECTKIYLIDRLDNGILLPLNKKNYYKTNENLKDENNGEYIHENPEIKNDTIKENEEENNISNNPKSLIEKRKSIKKEIYRNTIANSITHCFTYKGNIYEYDQITRRFQAAFFYLGEFTTVEIYEKFGEGIKTLKDYNYNLNRYGLNNISKNYTSFMHLFFVQIFDPFYLYQIFSLIIWTIQGYTPYNIIIFLFIVTIVFLNSYFSYKICMDAFKEEVKDDCRIVRGIKQKTDGYDSK